MRPAGLLTQSAYPLLPKTLKPLVARFTADPIVHAETAEIGTPADGLKYKLFTQVHNIHQNTTLMFVSGAG